MRRLLHLVFGICHWDKVVDVIGQRDDKLGWVVRGRAKQCLICGRWKDVK